MSRARWPRISSSTSRSSGRISRRQSTALDVERLRLVPPAGAGPGSTYTLGTRFEEPLMTRSIAATLGLVLIGTTVVVPQQQSRRVLTAADYDRAVKMLAQNLNGLVVGGSVDANWMKDGRFWYVRTT